MASQVRLNKTTVDSLPFPEKGQVFYWDSKLSAFGMYVGKTSKTWIVQQRIAGKTRRVVLGKYPAITPEQAEALAKKEIGKMTTGIDPTAAKREAKAKAVTLGEVFASFVEDRQLKPKTLKEYNRVMSHQYGGWLRLPITEISRDLVEKRHKQLGTQSGEASANLAARTLRSVLNYAQGKYEVKGVSVLADNPVKRISQTRSWYKVERRTGHLKPHQLKAWFSAVLALESPIIRDYLIFIILTGCRAGESAKLQWRDVDLKNQSYFLRDPKNNNPTELPLSDYLVDVLTQRKQTATSDFVFPSTGKAGHLIEPKKQLAKVIAATGDSFTLHDLRRTFVTIAEALDIPMYSLKMLVNHKQDSNDVTSGYIQINAERLRLPMQKITDFMLKSAEIKAADVVELKSVKHG
jgi:integrase